MFDKSLYGFCYPGCVCLGMINVYIPEIFKYIYVYSIIVLKVLKVFFIVAECLLKKNN